MKPNMAASKVREVGPAQPAKVPLRNSNQKNFKATIRGAYIVQKPVLDEPRHQASLQRAPETAACARFHPLRPKQKKKMEREDGEHDSGPEVRVNSGVARYAPAIHNQDKR